jgi:hypothetical protein
LKKVLVLITCWMLLAGPMFAKELAVTPSVLYWRVASFGQEVKMPALVKIHNRSSRRRLYSLKAMTPEQINAKVDPGYEPILDPGWVVFQKDEVEVLPDIAKEVAVFINIPEHHKDKSWLFYIEVKEKPPAGDKFALACYPKIYVKEN